MVDNVDFTSDLNTGGDTTVDVQEGSVSSIGKDAVDQNNQRPEPLAPRVKAPVVAKTEPTIDGQIAEKPLSLRDQISSALKIEGEDTPASASLDGKPRDASGKFIAAPAIDPNAPVLDPLAPAAPTVAAPQGMDPEIFKALPAEMQVNLARTMDDLNARQQRTASLEQVEQLIGPRRDAWALNGMTEHQALNQLFALSDYAGRDPAGFIQYIAQNAGVDLEALVIGQDDDTDPKYSALERQVQELQTERQREAQMRTQAAHEQTVSGVVTFASEKGQDGNLLRPYFDELGSDVLPFITSVKAQNPNMPQDRVLQEAYDRACWGSPSVRAKMQAATNAAAEAERLRNGAEKVGRARNASASIPSGAPASAPAAPNDPSRSLRDTIRASLNAAQ